MIILYHRSGTKERPPCNGPALGLIQRMATLNYGVPAENVVKLDGTVPQANEPMICGSCNQPIYPHEIDR